MKTGRAAIKTLFTKGPTVPYRALLVSAAAVGLILVNLYTDWLDPVRDRLGAVAAPFYWMTDLPERTGQWWDDTFISHGELREENEALRTEALIHRRKLQQMASLAAENVRLRQLLNASETLEEQVLIAELIGVSPNPLSHTVVINRGREHNVYRGQSVLDAYGLMGQVIEVHPYTSRVLLITDTSHALPVQINRNGVRAVAEGSGDLNRLWLRHVSNTTDVREGDVVVSSGLGGRFPVGYPVAEVESVERDPGQAFARVALAPRARLDRSRHLLLVFGDDDDPAPQADQAPAVDLDELAP